MEDLNKLSTETLVDLLSTQTEAYLQMHANGSTKEEFEKCWLLLSSIQKELDSRIRNKSRKVKSKD